MTVGVLKEPSTETRVSILPEHLATLKKWKVDVLIESTAGVRSFANDNKYAEAGATIASRDEVLGKSDIVLSINNFSAEDISKLKPGAVVLGVYQPLFNATLIKDWAEKGLNVFSIDMIPRT